MVEAGESEWPVVMIYEIFIAIVLILGIFMVIQLISISESKVSGDISEFNYAILAGRILNSADCLAWEESFYNAEGEQNWQVRPGIIDWLKVEQEHVQNCINGKKFRIEVIDFTDDTEKMIQTEEPGVKIRDLYFVKIMKSGKLHDGIIAIALFEE